MTDHLPPNARPMTPLDALAYLDAATTPANVAKLNRADFANIQVALEVLARALQPATGSSEAGNAVVAHMNGKTQGPLTLPQRGGKHA